MNLKKNEIHLWYQVLEVSPNTALHEDFLSLLSDEEMKKLKSFKVIEKKYEYLMTRVLSRKTLSHYLNTSIDEIKFNENENGRPEIAYPKNAAIQFNISHCKGLLVLAVATECEVGVDVEFVKPFADMVHLAEKNFSLEEALELKSYYSEKQIQKFYEIWTLKEAYIKARGKGFAIPLKDFSFNWTNREDIHFSVKPSVRDSAKNWKFILREPTEHHQMALAIRQNGNLDFKLIENWNILTSL